MVEPFITRVALKNYKSIETCNVQLWNLMFLVGRNASGKSNFLDALRFVADSLSNGVDHALRDRGSIKEVRRRSGGHPTHFAIGLDFNIPNGPQGHYGFRIAGKPNDGFEVQEERCSVTSIDDPFMTHSYVVKSGKVEESSSPAPATVPDRLALVNYAGIPVFRPVYDALSRIEIYNLNPQAISMPQPIDPSTLLRRDGSNAATILRHTSAEDSKRINDYLARIVPGFKGVEPRPLGAYETMQFQQVVNGSRNAWGFPAASMSDGTLRAFGVLLATMQSPKTGPLLLGIEEPETAVHPSAATVILQSLRHAAEHRQILITSHSPDLLDDPDIEEREILSVRNVEGTTWINTLGPFSRTAIRESLMTPGELLRRDKIDVDETQFGKTLTERQLNLFGAEAYQ